MNANRVDDLARLYRLLLRVGAQDKTRTALSSFIKRTGQVIVMDTDKDATMVQVFTTHYYEDG